MAQSALLQELTARRKVASEHAILTQRLRDDVYKYALPYRRGNGQLSQNGSGNQSAGQSRVNDIFDHTAGDSAFRFAGKLQQDLFPAGEENFSLEPGPLVPANERDGLKKILSNTTAIVQAACFENGDYDLAFHEMALDLNAGTGAILMNGGDGIETVWEPISVPINELLLEGGANNKISGIFWQRNMTLRQIFDTWPEGKLDEKLRKMRKETPGKELKVNLDSFFERKKNRTQSRWKTIVWCKEQDEHIFVSSTRVCPWSTPRYFRVPGEVYGRGLAMIAMPTIKTLDVTKRLYLQAASIAMLGIYTQVDDGVFNPDNSPLTPGSFMTVARNGGPMGPSIQRLPDPRLDLTSLVVRDMQTDVRTSMLDQALPVEGAAVKSATEIMERVKRLASDHVGAFGRLVKELITPSVKRAIETTYDAGLLPDIVDIDQLLVQIKVNSPLAIAHEMQRVQKIMQWLEMVFAILSQGGDPSRIDEFAKIDLILREMGTKMGVPNEFIVPEAEAKQKQEEKQKQAMTMAAASAALQGANGAPGGAGGAPGGGLI